MPVSNDVICTFNELADHDMNNAVIGDGYIDGMNKSGHPVIIYTYKNGQNGVRVWSDGYCLQWGYYDYGSYVTAFVTYIQLYYPYIDSNYHVICTSRSDEPDHWPANSINPCGQSTKGFSIYVWGVGNYDLQRYAPWVTRGYVDTKIFRN